MLLIDPACRARYGQREALLFLLEEETNPHRFSIYRLIHYCVDLSEHIGAGSEEANEVH